MTKQIAYIVSRFPSVWETFILREIIELKNRGFDIVIFSLKSPPKGIVHKDAEGLAINTQYSAFLLSYNVLLSQLFFITRKPLIYFGLIIYIAKHCFIDFSSLIKSFGVFPKSIHYARICRQKKITHIHAHWATIPTLTAIIISRLNEIPFSVTAHAIDIFENNTMIEEKLSAARFIVTCTKDNKNYLTENFSKIESKKILINYHGIDLEKFQRKTVRNSNPINILSVGRIETSKGYPFLIEACKNLKTGYAPIRCTIIGDGPKKRQVEQLIRKSGLNDCINMTGALPMDEVIKYYEESDIFVLSAVSQFHWGIPNVIIEAMAMELPVITTPLPAMKELIQNERHGIIIPEKDSKTLADEILKLVESKELRIRIGRGGRERVKQLFDIDKTISELIDIYEKWI